ncbi:MAG: 3-hydroxyisobutyrate dehydrogenase [Candidatus Entotheonella factor]|uniref:3-hydroxyisobutyrate dehydrogenase n=1 Tax=Entotheonella factor TaxID=1429438 RepID=W4L6K0_ENTF1|nr:NAD(P)-dependent oxidoreductase [Candidatus Entotheonella palauensis]ETW93524.1 MAG: 3-hydroxyisobutyrate dehydrogenase [Candidatus Entotheonella factor]
MKVGFIGLGTMGSGMAMNILKGGFDMVVHDINRDAAGPYIEEGATWADTPREVAEGTQVVFSSLPGPPEVESVALNSDSGLLAGVTEGKVYFDLSTNSPTLVRRIHQVFSEKGAHVLDAPVSGGPAGAQSGRLAIWVGGDKAIYEQYKHVLDAFGDKPFYVGEIGTGSIAKLVHNCSGYVVQTALAETFTMGIKAGVDPLTLWQAVRHGALGRRGVFDGLPNQFLPGEFDPPDFALRLARKDVTLAVGVGREYDVPMRLAHMTLEEMTEAMNRGWDGRDSRVAMLLQEERAGVEVKVPREQIQQVIDRENQNG